MKKRLVLWGENAQNEKVLIAAALKELENKVEITVFPLEVATEEFAQQMMNDWRNGEEVSFPDQQEKIERPLNLSQSLLPEDIKVDRTDVVNRAQTEWNFVVMSSKLKDAYESELEDFRARVQRLESFDHSMWEELKSFWDKVQGQIREKNLFGGHAYRLRKATNETFDEMKELRRKMDEEFKEKSKEVKAKFQEELEEIEENLEKGLGLKPLFEELKKVQKRFKKASFTREDRSKIWKKLDGLFKDVKEKRFGEKSPQSGKQTPLERLERRYKGLQKAINKMQSSIGRDKKDLSFEEGRIDKTDGQLEQQIRTAKLKMIEERISSKEVKLQDMLNTRKMLEERMEKEVEKQRALEIQKEKQKAKEEAKQKIQEQIQAQQSQLSAEEKEKLEKAASDIASKKEARAEAPETEDEVIDYAVQLASSVSKVSIEEEEE